MKDNSSSSESAVLRMGELEVRFYMREPSPDHWNAVGIIVDSENVPEFRTSTSSRMIVGVGTTSDEAIGDLVARFVVETGSSAAFELEPSHATANVL